MIGSVNNNAFNFSRENLNINSSQHANSGGISLTITPDAGNVSSGDKSQNSFDVKLVTPRHELNSSFTREQAVARVETNIKKNAVKNALNIGNNHHSPIKSAAIIKAAANNDLGSGEIQETAVELAAVKFKYNQAQHVFDLPGTNETDSSSSSTNSSNYAVSVVTRATDFYIKSSLIFSAADKIGDNIDTQF